MEGKPLELIVFLFRIEPHLAALGSACCASGTGKTQQRAKPALSACQRIAYATPPTHTEHTQPRGAERSYSGPKP